MTYKKKLIEVALPLELINRESVREGYIYKGNPSSLHKWWAQRPLASCRALIFASLVDDPSARPDRFPTEIAQHTERERLFRIIEELVVWENTTNLEVLGRARDEIRLSCDGNPPPVYDPFCGGGSIPVEAQRLGLDVYASDLNPVAVLLTKALIEIPTKFSNRVPVHPDGESSKTLATWVGAQGLADDVRYYGNWMRDEAERRIGSLYPSARLPADLGGGDADVIAWIWARVVTSPNPAWDGPMPLVKSFALSTKQGKEMWADPVVDHAQKRIRFEVRSGRGWPEATVGESGARCTATQVPVPLCHIKEEAQAGRMGFQLMAMAVAKKRGRTYISPDKTHERVAASVLAPEGAPDTDLPKQALGFRVQAYGMTKHRHLFSNRQLVAMCTFSDLVLEAREKVCRDGGDSDYADAIATYLAFAVDKMAEYGCTLVPWYSKEDRPKGLFAQATIPMVWDFAEINPLGSIGGTFQASVRIVADALAPLPAFTAGECRQLDATQARWSLPPALFVTDPPYYDNMGYADLSDFFYVWMRRSLRRIYPDVFSTLLVPKDQELVADPARYGGSQHLADEQFELGIGAAFARMRELNASDFPLTVLYAFKQSEKSSESQVSTGWEKMLQGLLHAGLSIHGTWPLRSERGGRMRDIGSNALASSIALVCRPRPEDAALATRKEFLAALKVELPEALRHLQQGNIAPVDLAQAALGPGMGVFSRYSRVVEADGRPMVVRTALGLINQVLDETLAEQESDFDAETRWALAWFEQVGMNPGHFGVAETLSKAKNTAVNALVLAGFLESKGGKVRLLDRDQLSATWDPATDTRLTVWEVTQHLIRVLESDGEAAAAELLRRVGGLGETARELAYRLYVLCERKKWAKEALAYNGLVVAWPEIARLAAGQAAAVLTQETLPRAQEKLPRAAGW